MEINLKIKFDKHNKTNTWDRPEPAFFFDHPPTKRTHYSPKSYREELRHPSIEHAPKANNGSSSNRKVSTAKKSSNSKVKIDKKTSTVHKNGSENLKKVKKKMPVVEQSQLADYDSLRGSLPGLPGKKVLQRF